MSFCLNTKYECLWSILPHLTEEVFYLPPIGSNWKLPEERVFTCLGYDKGHFLTFEFSNDKAYATSALPRIVLRNSSLRYHIKASTPVSLYSNSSDKNLIYVLDVNGVPVENKRQFEIQGYSSLFVRRNTARKTIPSSPMNTMLRVEVLEPLKQTIPLGKICVKSSNGSKYVASIEKDGFHTVVTDDTIKSFVEEYKKYILDTSVAYPQGLIRASVKETSTGSSFSLFKSETLLVPSFQGEHKTYDNGDGNYIGVTVPSGKRAILNIESLVLSSQINSILLYIHSGNIHQLLSPADRPVKIENVNGVFKKEIIVDKLERFTFVVVVGSKTEVSVVSVSGSVSFV